jgi:hypothetical protein
MYLPYKKAALDPKNFEEIVETLRSINAKDPENTRILEPYMNDYDLVIPEEIKPEIGTN